MECNEKKTLSRISLVISVLPLLVFIPVLLEVTLPEGVSTVWAAVNAACAVAGLILSVLCVRSKESRSLVNIASAVISVFWCLLMAGRFQAFT